MAETNIDMEKIKKSCIFCKIVSNEIPAHKIYEDDEILVVLDIRPVNTGHCLILPKEHYFVSAQLPPQLFGKMTALAKKIASAFIKEMGYKGANILISNGQAAGQKISHMLIHVIPRKEGDNFIMKLPENKIEDVPAYVGELKKILNL